jgi:hypothetical protein
VRLGKTDAMSRLQDMEDREKEWWKLKSTSSLRHLSPFPFRVPSDPSPSPAGFLKDPKDRTRKRLVVQQRVETFMGQVLMAKSAGMSLYNNNRFEQSYITFKAEAETLRTMCDQTIKNATSVS